MTARRQRDVVAQVTATGQTVNPFAEGLGSIDLEDIGRCLSHQPFGLGHTPRFVSMAQYAILAARSGPPSEGRYALLWLSPVCYVGAFAHTIPAALYQMPSGDWIDSGVLYQAVLNQVLRHFGLPDPTEPLVARMLESAYRAAQTVHRDVGPQLPEGKQAIYPYRDPLPEKVEPLPPEGAFKAYLEAFREYRKASPKRDDAHLLN